MGNIGAQVDSQSFQSRPTHSDGNQPLQVHDTSASEAARKQTRFNYNMIYIISGMGYFKVTLGAKREKEKHSFH